MATVLVADDVPEVRYSLKRSLVKAGHSVIEAEDGAQAIALLRLTPADIVITDVWMPNVDGIGMMRALRREFPSTKIIAITGGGRTAPIDFTAALATTWGADRIFTKPFENDDLVREIAALLNGQMPH